MKNNQKCRKREIIKVISVLFHYVEM